MSVLNGNIREKNTLHSVKAVRRKGMVPGILYGKEIQNTLFEISEIELNKEFYRKGECGLLEININNKIHNGIIKEVQRDSINNKIIHIDLEEADPNKKIVTDVPLCFHGEGEISKKGGFIQKQKENVKVRCISANIPKHIDVDLGSLKFGQGFKISDVEFGGEITFTESPNTILAIISSAHNNPGETKDPNMAISKAKMKTDSTIVKD